MSDESLRLRAEVIDAFSGPLRKLRNELGLVRAPAELARIRENMRGLRDEVTRAGDAVRNVLGGAMGGLGIGMLAGAGSIVGITAAMREYTKSTAEASRVSRDVGLSINQLEKLRSFASRIGASGDEMIGSAKQFASNLFDLKRRTGQMREELLKSGSGGRQLAEEMFNAKDFEEAYGKALGFLSRMRSPEQARRLSELMFGSGTIGRVSEMGPQKLAEAMREIGKSIGDMEKAAQASRELEEKFAKMQDNLRGFKNELATQLLPIAIKGVEELRDTLKTVDWDGWRKGAGVAFGEIKTFAVDLSGMLKEIRALLNNDWSPLAGKGIYKARPGVAQGLFGVPNAGTEANSAMVAGRLSQQAELQRRLEDARKRGDQPSVIALERKLEIIADELKKLNQKADGAPSAGGGFEKMSFGAGGVSGGMLHMASLGGGGGGGGGGLRQRMATFGAGVRESVGMGGGGAPATGPMSGRAKSLMDRLVKEHGWTPAAAAIAAGNSEQESGIRSNGPMGDPSVPGGSWGMFQWNRSRLAALKGFAEKRGAHWQDFNTQIDFFAQEASKMIPGWKSVTDLSNAGAIGKRFEGYGDNSTGRRVSNAQKWLRAYQGGFAGAGGADAAGMNIKPGAGGGHEALMSLGKMLQASGMVKRFTAFKDAFHKGRPGSLHNQGLAGDFSLNDPRMARQAADTIRNSMRAAGLTDDQFQVIDEYNNPSKGSTGGHIHYGFRSGDAATRFQRYFAERQELAKAAREARDKPAAVEGAARVDINLNGFPRGTKTNADATGLFRDVKIKRGDLMASGGVGV